MTPTPDCAAPVADAQPSYDSPVGRVAHRLRECGWAVTRRRYGDRFAYDAKPVTESHEGLTIIVQPVVNGALAELLVKTPDSVWHFTPFCGDAQQRRVCELLGLTPADLWSLDVRQPTEMAA